MPPRTRAYSPRCTCQAVCVGYISAKIAIDGVGRLHLERILRETAQRGAIAVWRTLNPIERRILEHLTEGKSRREIADAERISEDEVERHVRLALEKIRPPLDS